MLDSSGVPFDKGWNRIRSEFMEKIEDKLESLDNYRDERLLTIRPSDYIKYYTLVYNMCVQKDSNHAELLYARLGETLSEYVKTKMCAQLEANRANESGLKEMLLNSWAKYKYYLHILTGIFAYLDRFYVPLAVQPTIHEYGMAIFQRLIFEPYKHFLKTVVLNALDSKRSGGDDDPNSDIDITNIVEMFNKLDSTSGTQYKMELEPFILDRANGYYLKIAPLWIKELSLSDYLHIVQHCMDEESIYCEKYFNESTKEQLLATIISSLLFNQRRHIFNKFTQLFSLFMDNEVKELKRMYKSLSKLEGAHQCIAEQLKRAVEESLMNGESGNRIQNTIETFSKFKNIAKTCFCDENLAGSPRDSEPNPIIQNAFLSAFEEYIGRDSMFVKRIVEYWNDLIVNTQMNESILSDLTEIFNLLNKDEFLALYRIELAQRLLSDGHDLEVEKRSIAKLRLKLGTQCTFGLDNMIMDVCESKEFAKDFGVDIMVMSSLNWPPIIEKHHDAIKLHDSFSETMEKIKETYLLKTRHRKINWVFPLCHVQMSCFVNDSETIVDCDVLQASVLLLLNDSHDGSLDVAYLQKKLLVDYPTLMEILQPMIVPDSLLKCYTIFGKELVEVNQNFSGYNNFTRNIYKQTESVHTNRGEEGIKDFGRIDSVIVKMMKNAKEMKSVDLLDKTAGRLDVDLEIIRARISVLAEREYISMRGDTIVYLP